MEILVVGHCYIVDTNRQLWSRFAKFFDSKIDLVCPKSWQSNLQSKIEFKQSEITDNNFQNLIPIDVYKSGNGSLYSYKWTKLLRTLRTKKYDAIYLHQETWALSLFQIIALKLLSPNKKTPLFLYVHQNIIKKKLFFIVPWERLLTSFVCKIFYSTSEIEDVLCWKKIKSERTYMPLSYDENIYNKINSEIFKGQTVKIGYLGRLTHEKGINTLISACKKLIDNGNKIELHLAGNGPLVSELNLPFIKYLGILPHNKAHEFYQNIDLFVLPSLTTPNWKEQFGRVLIEAMASGVPVVGSSSGSIPEILKKIEWNYVFKENNVESLAQVILEIINLSKNSSFQAKLEQSIKLNKDLFSIKAVCGQFFKEFSVR